MKVRYAVISQASIDLDYPKLWENDLKLRFWNALKQISATEMVFLSRTIGVSVDTIRSWRYGRSLFPRDPYHVIAVIRWVDDGKPTEVDYDCAEAPL